MNDNSVFWGFYRIDSVEKGTMWDYQGREISLVESPGEARFALAIRDRFRHIWEHGPWRPSLESWPRSG